MVPRRPSNLASTIARVITSFGLCMISLVAAHDLAYRLVRPGGHHGHEASRERVDAMHAYVAGLSSIATFVAVAGVILVILVSARQSSLRSARPARRHLYGISALLPLAFCAMEIIERIPIHGGLPPWDIIIIGVSIQVACGLAAGVIVTAVIAGAECIARVATRRKQLYRPARRSGTCAAPRICCDTRRARSVCLTVLRWRGPPALYVS